VDNELYEVITEVGRAGFLVHSYRIDRDGPLAVAMVLDRGDCADVVILHDERRAYAYRTPTGDGQDVLDPDQVCWDCPGQPVRALRAVLGLAAPGENAAPTVVYAPQPGLCLPAERRGAKLTIRRRGI
jgi:hypothetical protein